MGHKWLGSSEWEEINKIQLSRLQVLVLVVSLKWPI